MSGDALMSFDAELAAGLAELRIHAESKMRATCVIERPNGETTVGGVVTPAWTEVYAGKCELTDFDSHPIDREVSGATLTMSSPSLRLPVSAPSVAINDRVRITSDPDNPDLVGLTAYVSGVRRKGMEKSRRITVSDTQSGVIG